MHDIGFSHNLVSKQIYMQGVFSLVFCKTSLIMILWALKLCDDSELLSIRPALWYSHDMGVSKNSGTPKSSILIGCSITNHPFWGTTIFGNTHINLIPLILLLRNSILQISPTLDLQGSLSYQPKQCTSKGGTTQNHQKFASSLILPR